MLRISQDLWNLLFSFLGERCMLPEGCTLPKTGILFYTAIIVFSAIVIHQREKIVKGKSDLIDAISAVLEMA